MNEIDELFHHNKRFAEAFGYSHLDLRPARQVAVVACMDSRLDVFSALGLENGEAHIIRNAGGVITDDVIRSLSISQRLLDTRHIMLIHHTDCGMQKITDDGFRRDLANDAGMTPSFAIESFTNLDLNVLESMARIHNSPFLLHKDSVRGFVYDVNTGRLREITTKPG